MKNFKNILVLLLVTFLFSGCNTIKKGFAPDKRNGEEILVEKKSPLVMPPEFNELPVPNSNSNISKKNEETIESLISNSENKTENNIEDSDQNLEKTILDKIKE
jgi:hypothetical protein